MKKQLTPLLVLACAAGSSVTSNAQQNPQFANGSLVVSRSVYQGTASLVTNGEALPLGCQGGATGLTVSVPKTTTGSYSVAVPCGYASDNGEYPNLSDSHNVWNNAVTDPSFGVTSPIFLDNITTDGYRLSTIAIPSSQIVTSFSSKSEVALNRSADKLSLTFMGYVGGVGCGGSTVSPTRPNLLDVSNSNTPGVCDPTNPVYGSDPTNPSLPTAYYRGVAEVDLYGNLTITPGNAYSGNNGRAAFKGANDIYYMVGNDNNGNLGKTQITATQDGINLVNSTGAELLYPQQTPTLPPNIDMIGRLLYSGDKAGKDTNFRGLTIYNNTEYVDKGSGSNGYNTVYQVGTAGTLSTGTAASLATVPLTVLPGFPNTTASTSTSFPFGLFFANPTTLYVCDEGDGTFVPPTGAGSNVADAQAHATAGLQKWSLINGTWVRQYVIQNGLNIGVPYAPANYPSTLYTATDGCRNIAGKVSDDGYVTIWAVTSTVSANGDEGADPNNLVKVIDKISATSLPNNNYSDYFTTIYSAKAGEVLRGVTLSPDGPGADW